MVPTVGRIVHLFPGPHREDLHCNGMGADDPIAAVVTRVWADSETPCLNLVALVDGPAPVWVTSVLHATSTSPGSMRWDWPART